MLKQLVVLFMMVSLGYTSQIQAQSISQQLKSQFDAVEFIETDNQQLAKDIMWRVQGPDTLPEWIFNAHNHKNLTLGVSIPSNDTLQSRNQAIANAVLAHLLKNGINVFSLTEMYTFSEDNENKTVIEELKKGGTKKLFNYNVVKEYKSKFGEYFCLVEVKENKSNGKNKIVCQIESYTKYTSYNNADHTNEEGFYKLDIELFGLPGLERYSTNIYRSNNNIEPKTSINSIEVDHSKIFCTYQKRGEIAEKEHITYTKLNKGFWYPYITSQLMQIFYQDSSEQVHVSTIVENYKNQMREITRFNSMHIIKIDPSIVGISSDNNLKVETKAHKEKINLQ